MHAIKTVDKREFIQHTSKYLKWVEQEGKELIIIHQNKPYIMLTKIKQKTVADLQNITKIIAYDDVNESTLPKYDEW